MIGNFDFCSTHPSYVLIDLHMLAFCGFLVWLGSTASLDMFVFWLAPVTAAFILIARLFAWYVLGLKLDKTHADEVYEPVLWSLGITLLISAIAAVTKLAT